MVEESIKKKLKGSEPDLRSTDELSEQHRGSGPDLTSYEYKGVKVTFKKKDKTT